MAENITVEDVIKTFKFSDKYNAEQLKTEAMYFVKSKIAEIVKTDAFDEKLLHLMSFYSESIKFFIK